MITELQTRWRDPSNNVVTRARWLGYINQAQQRFVKRTKFPTSKAFSNLAFSANEASKVLPTDVWAVLTATDTTNDRPLTPIYGRDQHQHLWNDDSGTASHFTIEDNDLYLFAPPRTAITVQILHLSPISDLTDSVGAAGTPVFPSHYHRALMDGAMELAFRDDQNIEMAGHYAKDFKEMLADALVEFAKPRLGRNVPIRNDYFEVGRRPFREGL